MVPTSTAAPVDLSQRQRASDLHERAILGGAFYLLAWLLVAGFGDAWDRYPLLSAAFAALFSILLVLRGLIRAWSRRHPAAARNGMRAQWGVLLLTAALWGGISSWALLDDSFAAATTVTLISTVSLSTAFAQIFAVNRRLSLLGTGMLYLPMLGIVLGGAQPLGVAMVLLLNLIYLVAVISRSHREYEGKMALDEALREQRDRFAEQSRTDALTGLANRGHFQERLNAALGDHDGDSTIALLIIDLDHFKAINDRHGHAAGDRCLREVAHLLRASFVGTGMLVARLGGEEFGVLASGPDSEATGLLAETFRARLDRMQIELDSGQRLRLTASLGLARYSADHHAGGDALYAAADEALYRAKAGGRNRLEAA